MARGSINLLTDGGETFIPLFITLSTPWEGHPGAMVGLDRSPVVLPCWYDMSPGSPYITSLSNTPLSPGIRHYLLFGYQGKSAIFTEGNTDGTLPLASMLSLEMQENATKVYGFNENHAGILTSPDVASRLNRILSLLHSSDINTE